MIELLRARRSIREYVDRPLEPEKLELLKVAQSLGLGSCWVQVRSRRFDDQMTSEQYIQKLLRIPEHIKVESVIAIGYPAEKREPLPRASLKDAKVHANGYRE